MTLATPNAAPQNLDELFTLMVSGETGDDWSWMPAYGGSEPNNTEQTWSWDETRLIVGTCATDIRIVDRADYA